MTLTKDVTGGGDISNQRKLGKMVLGELNSVLWNDKTARKTKNIIIILESKDSATWDMNQTNSEDSKWWRRGFG